jgi:hypothetical protein
VNWSLAGFLVALVTGALGIYWKVNSKSATDEAEQVGELRASDNAERVIADKAERQAENNARTRDADDVANRLRRGR